MGAATILWSRYAPFQSSMLYLFPYEDLFVWGISVLILALLCLRFVVVRRQRQIDQDRISTTKE